VAHELTVAAVSAVGPDGTSDGDNPAIVYRVIENYPGASWYSSWYASPEFGNLKSGTGILLDMGRNVTVRAVDLVLGGAPGADIQVQVGDGDPADQRTVAEASDVGGTVRLPTTPPAHGRYVLIWFTRLPPLSHGKYQIAVYRVTIDGTNDFQ
jgi:hypothetical protein